MHDLVLAMRLHPSCCSRCKKGRLNNKGGEAPKGAPSTCPHQIGCGRVLSGGRSPSGAPPRLSPATRRLADSAPGHASWDVDPAGATRLHLSQSRDCTSRTGRSTGVTDARSRPGAECKSARRHRSRSVFRLAFRKASLTMSETAVYIILSDQKSILQRQLFGRRIMLIRAKGRAKTAWIFECVMSSFICRCGEEAYPASVG